MSTMAGSFEIHLTTHERRQSRAGGPQTFRAGRRARLPAHLDAAQSFGHLPISITALDVDFVVFSGHKAMALPGTGAIWSRDERGPVFAPGGWRGSPNTSGVVSLAAAMASDPELVPLLEARAEVFRYRPPAGFTAGPGWHAVAARTAGFIEAGLLWREGRYAALAAAAP